MAMVELGNVVFSESAWLRKIHTSPGLTVVLTRFTCSISIVGIVWHTSNTFILLQGNVLLCRLRRVGEVVQREKVEVN